MTAHRHPTRLSLLVVLVAVAAGCAPKRVLRDGHALAPGEEPYAVVVPTPTRPALSDTVATAPAPATRVLAGGHADLPAPRGYEVVTVAREQVGIPYRYGGASPRNGFDCSGLVQWTYGRIGVALPRTAAGQARVGQPVDRHALEAGDLLFFATRGGASITHVGIYLGKQRFVHAPGTGDHVRTDSLNDAWWRQRWKATRRVLDTGSAQAMR